MVGSVISETNVYPAPRDPLPLLENRALVNGLLLIFLPLAAISTATVSYAAWGLEWLGEGPPAADVITNVAPIEDTIYNEASYPSDLSPGNRSEAVTEDLVSNAAN